MFTVGKPGSVARFAGPAAVAAMAAAALAAVAPPAQARVFFGIGVPCCVAPAPWYYPPPYYYPPAPPYYPPPAAPVPAPTAAPAAVVTPQISYTSRPPFRNAAGQTCREYRTSGGGAGTACQDSAGLWRVAN